MTTLVDLLREAASRFGDRPAVSARVGLRDRAWSYEELWGRANAVAGYLRKERALAPGTSVVVWAPNSPQLVATYFGVMLARLILVPVDATATPEFAHRVTTAVKAGLVIAGGEQPVLSDVPLLTIDELPDEAGPAFPER